MATVTPPANIGFGTVVGRFLTDAADGIDVDDLPDFYAATGLITFTKAVIDVKDATASPDPVTDISVPVIGILDDQGYLCTPIYDGEAMTAGDRGIKLVATDDTDLNPHDWTWSVHYALRSQKGDQLPGPTDHSIALPQGTTVDLTLAGHVESSTGDAVTVIVGPRGSRWFVGHGTPTAWETANPGVFATAVPYDEYLDLDTGNIYTFS
jgi:hypothetical protein